MSDVSEKKIDISDGSAHADYIFTRDKKYKESFDTTNKHSRLVPEISKKMKIVDIEKPIEGTPQVTTEETDNDIDNSSNLIKTNTETKTNNLNGVAINPSLSSQIEDQSDDDTLDDDNTFTFLTKIIILMIVFFIVVGGVFVLGKMRFQKS